MMDELVNEYVSFASAKNSSLAEVGLNVTCAPSLRRVYTPMGSYGMAAFVTYFVPIVVIVGILGNILTFILINESSTRIVGHYYIKMLTIFDSVSLVCLLPSLWAVLMVRPYHHYLDPFSFTWSDMISSGWGWCQARLFVTFLTRTMSIYTIVLFTLERCIQVMLPFVGQRLSTITNARRSIIVLLIAAVGVSIPYIFVFDKKSFMKCGRTTVVCKANMIFFKVRFMKMFLLSVVPSLVILVCNILIIVKMRKSVRSIYRQPAANSGDNEAEANELERKQNREITIRLLSVSFAFFILNMPLFVITSAHNVYELTNQHVHKKGAWADAFYFALLLFVVNLSINFVLYCLTGRMFRKAAVALLTCKMNKMRHYRSSLSGPSKSTRVSHVPRSESGRKLLKHGASFQQESQM